MKLSRLWVVRPDRLGDVLVSLSVIQALKSRFPRLEISALVAPSVATVLQGHRDLASVEAIPQEDRTAFFRERRESLKPDAVLILQNTTSVSAALRCAGVPKRFGPRGKLGARLWYASGPSQRRSRVEMSEAQYGLQLAEWAWKAWTQESVELRTMDDSVLAPRLSLNDVDRERAREFLGAAFQDSPHELRLTRPIVIHPGMGGSARNWPIENYAALLGRLSESNVVISVGPQDQEIGRRLKQILSTEQAANRKIAFWGLEPSASVPPSLRQTAALFEQASLVIAPSTGPLHLAAAVGAQVIGIYSPIRVQSAKRWGPMAWNPEASRVVTPIVACPQVYRCSGRACASFDCMETVTVERVLSLIQEIKGKQ